MGTESSVSFLLSFCFSFTPSNFHFFSPNTFSWLSNKVANQLKKQHGRPVMAIRKEWASKAREAMKRSAVACGWGGRWAGRAERAFRALKVPCTVWWWRINVILLSEYQAWTRRQTIGFGWLWCFNVGWSLGVTVPLRWVMLLVGKAVHVWGQRVDEKCLCFPFNIVLNLKVL